MRAKEKAKRYLEKRGIVNIVKGRLNGGLTYIALDDLLVKFAKEQVKELNNKDLIFLKEMKKYSGELLNERFDLTTLQHLDGMIQDWIDDLKDDKE